jgi:hypothetical protein
MATSGIGENQIRSCPVSAACSGFCPGCLVSNAAPSRPVAIQWPGVRRSTRGKLCSLLLTDYHDRVDSLPSPAPGGNGCLSGGYTALHCTALHCTALHCQTEINPDAVSADVCLVLSWHVCLYCALCFTLNTVHRKQCVLLQKCVYCAVFSEQLGRRHMCSLKHESPV